MEFFLLRNQLSIRYEPGPWEYAIFGLAGILVFCLQLYVWIKIVYLSLASVADPTTIVWLVIPAQNADLVLHSFLRGSFHGRRFSEFAYLPNLGYNALQFIDLDPTNHSQLQTEKSKGPKPANGNLVKCRAKLFATICKNIRWKLFGLGGWSDWCNLHHCILDNSIAYSEKVVDAWGTLVHTKALQN